LTHSLLLQCQHSMRHILPVTLTAQERACREVADRPRERRGLTLCEGVRAAERLVLLPLDLRRLRDRIRRRVKLRNSAMLPACNVQTLLASV
jgi:hypothetical protein